MKALTLPGQTGRALGTNIEWGINHLKMPDNLPHSRCYEVAERLNAISGATQWAFGDWYLHMVKHWNMRALASNAAWSGPAYETLRDYAKVCKVYPIGEGLRRPELSFNHHRVLVRVPIEARKLLLQKAIDENLSVAQLNDLGRAVRGIAPGRTHGLHVDPEVEKMRPQPAPEPEKEEPFIEGETVKPSEFLGESAHSPDNDERANFSRETWEEQQKRIMVDNPASALVSALSGLNDYILSKPEILNEIKTNAEHVAKLRSLGGLKDLLTA